MPNIKSAMKRVKVSARQNAENTAKKTRVKNAIKKFNSAVEAKDVELAEKLLKEATSFIDRAKSDGVYHANTASRKVASLSRQLTNLKAE